MGRKVKEIGYEIHKMHLKFTLDICRKIYHNKTTFITVYFMTV